jgi:hypothetical protein
LVDLDAVDGPEGVVKGLRVRSNIGLAIWVGGWVIAAAGLPQSIDEVTTEVRVEDHRVILEVITDGALVTGAERWFTPARRIGIAICNVIRNEGTGPGPYLDTRWSPFLDKVSGVRGKPLNCLLPLRKHHLGYC